MIGVDLWLLEVGKLAHLNYEICTEGLTLLHHKTRYKTAKEIEM